MKKLKSSEINFVIISTIFLVGALKIFLVLSLFLKYIKKKIFCRQIYLQDRIEIGKEKSKYIFIFFENIIIIEDMNCKVINF